MSEPNLLFPINVTIEPIDKTSTDFRRDAREPVRQVARGEPVTVTAQVAWVEENRPSPTPGGVEERTSGRLVVRFADLAALGYTPQRGDRITSLPPRSGDYYLLGSRPAATIGGAAKLLILFFSDRQPTRGA